MHEITFRYLHPDQQEQLTFTMLQVLAACGYPVTDTARLELEICQQFGLLEIGHLRPEQLEAARQWLLSVWAMDQLESRVQSVCKRLAELVTDVRTVYLLILRQRAARIPEIKRLVTIAALVLVSFLSAAVSAQPLQPPVTSSGAVDLTNARTWTETLTEEETQAWLSEYPAAAPYAILIYKVEKTYYLDNPAEYVVASLVTGDALVSARFKATGGLKLVRAGGLEDVPTPVVSLLSMQDWEQVSMNSILSDCDVCMAQCSGAARNVRGAEENVAVAKLGATAVVCAAGGAINVGVGIVCAGAALVVFYGDLNLAKQKYLQSVYMCGQSVCKDANGKSCRALKEGFVN